MIAPTTAAQMRSEKRMDSSGPGLTCERARGWREGIGAGVLDWGGATKGRVAILGPFPFFPKRRALEHHREQPQCQARQRASQRRRQEKTEAEHQRSRPRQAGPGAWIARAPIAGGVRRSVRPARGRGRAGPRRAWRVCSWPLSGRWRGGHGAAGEPEVVSNVRTQGAPSKFEGLHGLACRDPCVTGDVSAWSR